MRIELPNAWKPRDYQRPLWNYLEGGGKRALGIWHRRAGKDDVLLHRTAVAAFERVASYWTLLPEYAQARKALWAAVNPHTGKRRIDEAFPRELRESTNEQEMFIRFKNGSTWQLVGSDRYDTLVGAGVAGVTFSEWALADPTAWAYIRPMIAENDGWAAFITTPRGNNHAKSMYDMAKDNPEWFAEVLSVHTTGALAPEQLEAALADYISLYGEDVGTAQFEQEYLCSFNAAILGAYFGREMAAAEREGRICEVPVDYNHPVHTAWDLGKAANNPIWCFQVIDGQPRIVDFYRPESDDLEDWVKWLEDRGYKGTDYVPHDAINTEWGSKRTRVETLRLLGRKPWRIPQVSVEDGRMAARQTIKAAVFDAERCQLGIDGLKQYRREWDTELMVYRQTPVKDWAEHIGSAFRYLGLAWKEVRQAQVPEKKKLPLGYVSAGGGQIKPTLPSVDDILKGRHKARAS